jgi:hypothetical protein
VEDYDDHDHDQRQATSSSFSIKQQVVFILQQKAIWTWRLCTHRAFQYVMDLSLHSRRLLFYLWKDFDFEVLGSETSLQSIRRSIVPAAARSGFRA